MSPWVGQIAPQALSGITPPTTAITYQTGNQQNDRAQVTIVTPAGITAGDLMMFAVTLTPHFVNFGALSVAAGVTVLTNPAFTFGYSMVGYKLADANDAAATTTYSFQANNSGGIGYSRAMLASFPASFGTTPSTVQVTTAASPSISPTAGAGWYFVTGLNGKATAGTGSEPKFTMTSAGNLLLAQVGGPPAAQASLWSAESSVNPITGTYAFSGNQPAMSVIGITT